MRAGILVLAAAALVAAVPASAQTTTPDPYKPTNPWQGLFGVTANNSQTLGLRGSVFAAWQDIGFPPGTDFSLLDPAFKSQGVFSVATTSLDYAYHRSSDHGSAFVGARAWVAEYSQFADQPDANVDLSTGISGRTFLTRRTTFETTALAAYSPFYKLQPFSSAGFSNPADLQQTLTPGASVLGEGQQNVNGLGSAQLAYAISKHSNVSARLSGQGTYFLKNPDAGSLQVDAELGYGQQIWRKLNFRASYRQVRLYSYLTKDWSDPIATADISLDYGDALTLRLARRTTLTLGASLGTRRTLHGGQQYLVLGNAQLLHRMGRTWSMSAGISRGLNFLAAFNEPVLTDQASAMLSGQLAPRATFHAGYSIVRGYVGLDQGNHFDTKATEVSLAYALTRRIGAFAGYSNYRNTIPPGLTPLDLVSNSRQTALVGVNMYLPLYSSKGATPRDTR